MQFMPHSKMKNDAVGTVSDGWLGSVPQMWITLTAWEKLQIEQAAAPHKRERIWCLLPTPLANDSTGGLGNYMSLRKWWFNLGLGKAPSTRRPAFWEWMMGWPIGWTACDAAATDKFRQWQHSHSSSFPLVLANAAVSGRLPTAGTDQPNGERR